MKKIKKILLELEEHPTIGAGKPEQLKYEFAGLWSRRIDKKNRIVYSIKDEVVEVHILSILGHYEDK